MKITIGSDHGAVALKAEVKRVLDGMAGVEVKDAGTFDESSVDYPDIAEKVHLNAVLPHDVALLDDRERIAPRPIDDETDRE